MKIVFDCIIEKTWKQLSNLLPMPNLSHFILISVINTAVTILCVCLCMNEDSTVSQWLICPFPLSLQLLSWPRSVCSRKGEIHKLSFLHRCVCAQYRTLCLSRDIIIYLSDRWSVNTTTDQEKSPVGGQWVCGAIQFISVQFRYRLKRCFEVLHIGCIHRIWCNCASCSGLYIFSKAL